MATAWAGRRPPEPLFEAIETGDLDKVKLMTRWAVEDRARYDARTRATGRSTYTTHKPFDVDVPRPGDQSTALVLACYHRRMAIVSRLMEAGARVDIPNKTGCYPIHLLARCPGEVRRRPRQVPARDQARRAAIDAQSCAPLLDLAGRWR